MESLFYIHTPAMATYEIKRSKFMAHLVPFDQFDAEMERLRSEHPKARHYIYAYRHFNEHGQIVENQTDDGEPKGSSGKPSLNVLRGAGLINTALITVRYFGGTKLGVGGLVRAYSTAANMAIEAATLLEYRELTRVTLQVSYSNLERVKYLAVKGGSVIAGCDYNSDHVLLTVTLPADERDTFTHLMEKDLLAKPVTP